MKKFKFSLEKVLKIREFEEKEAQIAEFDSDRRKRTAEADKIAAAAIAEESEILQIVNSKI